MSAITQCKRCREYNAAAVDYRNQATRAQADYAALLASHNALRHNTKVIIKAYRENRKKYNALVEAVAWERECRDVEAWMNRRPWSRGDAEIWASLAAARAEVDRLLNEGADCKGEG